MPRVKKIEEEDKDVVKKKKSRKEILTVTGFRDILPQDQKYWQAVYNSVKQVANDYGYGQINPPVIEFAELYVKSTGKQTDIVEKEMYAFTDQGGDFLAVRPEGTPGAVRAFIQHGMLNLPQPVKLFYVGEMFRHEKPQSGRYRQFYQAGFEAIGDTGPTLDAQMILMGYNIMNDLGLDVAIQVNSIGCAACREEYKKALVKFYKNHTKDLCENCLARLAKNPMRLLDCKEPACQEIKDQAPQILDYLDEECKKHFMKVLEYLDELNLPYVLNPQIVRGLDYYNRTVFEYWSADDLDGKTALGGGGRYDGLVEVMGGRENTPACGFSLGVDRVVAKIREKEMIVPEVYQPDIFFAQLGDSAKKKAMALYEQLRRKFKMSQAFYKDNLKAQLDVANKLKVKYCLILGQKEVNEGTIMLRDMNGGVQEIIALAKIETEIAKRLEKYVGDEGVAIIDTEETRAALASKKRPDYDRETEESDTNDLNDYVAVPDVAEPVIDDVVPGEDY
jgi:histidyl-tRNA synthetase